MHVLVLLFEDTFVHLPSSLVSTRCCSAFTNNAAPESTTLGILYLPVIFKGKNVFNQSIGGAIQVRESRYNSKYATCWYVCNEVVMSRLVMVCTVFWEHVYFLSISIEMPCYIFHIFIFIGWLGSRISVNRVVLHF